MCFIISNKHDKSLIDFQLSKQIILTFYYNVTTNYLVIFGNVIRKNCAVEILLIYDKIYLNLSILKKRINPIGNPNILCKLTWKDHLSNAIH